MSKEKTKQSNKEDSSKKTKEKVESYTELIGGEIDTKHRGRLLFESIFRKEINDPLIYAVYPLDSEAPEITYETELVDAKGFHYRPPLSFIESFEHNLMKSPSEIEEYGTTKELWKEGSDLVADYVALDKEINFIVVWAMFYLSSWDRFDTSMNIIIRGSHGKGKSRLEDMFRWMVPRTLNACVCSSIAVLFRASAGLKPLILFDELTLNPKNPDFDSFVAIWNAGFKSDSGVIRNEARGGLKFKLKFFELHSPKIAILKGASPEQAFESRCLVIKMPPGNKAAWDLYTKRRAEGIDILELGDDFKERAQSFRNKLVMWKFRNWDRLKNVTGEFVLPGQASMRLFQVLNPMLTVINDKEENMKLFKYAQRGEKQREGEETPEIDIAVFKLIWRRLTGPIKDPLDLKTLLSELMEEATALGITDAYKITSQKLGYIVKHKLYLDTVRAGTGMRVVTTIENMIELASDLGIRKLIASDLEILSTSGRIAPIKGIKKKKKATNVTIGGQKLNI